MANPILVEVTRGGTIESCHRGAVAVVDSDGRVVRSIGDIEALIFPRSAFKMMQALALIESGAADAFQVSPQEFALACASHSGEPAHVEAVSAWLARIGCSENDLVCGPHPPHHEPSAHAIIREGRVPTRVHNNCSGKHTGFLTVARHLGAPPEGYASPNHMVQRMVASAIAELCELKPAEMRVGIDGCAAPNYAMPLRALAFGMARLANPSGLPPVRAKAARRLNEAVKANPFFVAGTGRFCTRMIEAAPGMTTIKTGAEGVFCGLMPEAGLGLAIKIDDGATRAAEGVMAGVLSAVGAIPPDHPAILSGVAAEIKNTRGGPVGVRRVTAILSELALQTRGEKR
jgi:L-asparaginase II